MPTTVSHFTTPQFWQHYNALPRDVQTLANKNFALLKADPSHSSLRLKKVGNYWSARVGFALPRVGVGEGGGPALVLDWPARGV